MTENLYFAAAAVGLALGIVGAGIAYSMGKIGVAAMEAISRQPEASDKVSGAMLPGMGMLEGALIIVIAVFGFLITKL
jgi:F-type H+-transporting ATPase subunit c